MLAAHLLIYQKENQSFSLFLFFAARLLDAGKTSLQVRIFPARSITQGCPHLA